MSQQVDALASSDDGKAPEAFRTIGEVSKALSIQPHVLRYWEEQFPMLRPVKRAGGRRLYRPEDVEVLSTIDRLVHREGFTLRGAKQWLQSKNKVDLAPEPVAATPAGDPQLLNDLIALRAQLARALA
jgi:DNA-binding transcriptional MerR regulator